MTWTTFTLQVQTPLFSGDDPNLATTDTPVRVPSIRGALRFWLRAVAAGHGVTSLDQLWAVERDVFGSTNLPSPIRLRIDRVPTAVEAGRTPNPDWTGGKGRRDFHGAQYLLGQGLWHFRNGLTRPHVAPNARFDLRVRLSPDERTNRRFLLAMWAWLTWGGLGARTRRGFGRLRCTAVDGRLPEPFTQHLTAVPSEDSWQTLAGDVIPAELRRPDHLGWPNWVESSEETALPKFPALCPAWWGAAQVAQPHRDFGEAMNLAGRRWRNFRSNSDLSRTPTQDDHSPEWIHAVTSTDRRYPTAALGLPIGYYSTKSSTKAEVNPVRGTDVLRRASPVWIMPVRLPDGTWLVLTHVFWAQLLPTGAELDGKLKANGRTTSVSLEVPSADLATQQWDAWLDQEQRLPDDFYERPATGRPPGR